MGMPPERPKPETSHTEIRDGRRVVPEQPAPNATVIWDGASGDWQWVGCLVVGLLLGLAVVVVLGALGVGGLRLQVWLLEWAGMCR